MEKQFLQMTVSIALIIFSSIGLISCLYMITYFIFIKKENKLLDLSLGLLFLAITLRVSKSVFYYVFSGISTLGVGIGFFGFASIGPLLYFYFKLSKNKNYQLQFKDTLHFVFAITGFCSISFFNSYHYEFYLVTKFQLAAYLLYIGGNYIFAKNGSHLSKWHRILFYSMVGLLGVFTFQFFIGNIKAYTVGTAIVFLITYVLFFIALKTPSVIKKNTITQLPQELLDKIKSTIEIEKIYFQPAITLAQFSEAINTPSYLVSKATKIIYNKSFPEVINSFRIKEITQKLKEPNHRNDKIEDLAYDVGFNTTSAFYSAFKKEISMTPRAYQKVSSEKV